MAYASIEAYPVPQAIADTSTVAKNPLGLIVRAVDSTLGVGEFIYLQGVASTAVGSFVTYGSDGVTALLAANAIGQVAIAMSACVASNYGWYQITGKGVGKVSALFADNGLVYATATAGEADDAVVIGDRVKQALGASAINTPTTGYAYIDMNRPFMDDASAA